MRKYQVVSYAMRGACFGCRVSDLSIADLCTPQRRKVCREVYFFSAPCPPSSAWADSGEAGGSQSKRNKKNTPLRSLRLCGELTQRHQSKHRASRIECRVISDQKPETSGQRQGDNDQKPVVLRAGVDAFRCL
jgi:hypothetical protein